MEFRGEFAEGFLFEKKAAHHAGGVGVFEGEGVQGVVDFHGIGAGGFRCGDVGGFLQWGGEGRGQAARGGGAAVFVNEGALHDHADQSTEGGGLLNDVFDAVAADFFHGGVQQVRRLHRQRRGGAHEEARGLAQQGGVELGGEGVHGSGKNEGRRRSCTYMR